MNPQLAARVGPDAAALMTRYRGWIWGPRAAGFGGVFAIILVFAVVAPITKYMLIAFLVYFPIAIAMNVVGLIKGRAAGLRAEVAAGAFVSKAGERTVARVPRVLMREPLTAFDAWLLDKHAWPTDPPAGRAWSESRRALGRPRIPPTSPGWSSAAASWGSGSSLRW